MDDIITALEQIKEKGSFYGKRSTSLDNFSLEIKELGLLKFPLTASKARALIRLAKPAKFGWRDQTLLDKEVRDAWEISKSKIKIAGSPWNKELKSVLELLKNDLGLPETATLKAHLHNLLIYEPGQFFEYHQDSEKLDGMVASLVIVLPSVHSGGSLIVEHHGVKKQFKTSQFPLDRLTFIAFYADCHHEVKAIKEGYRVALTYNIVLENNSTKIEVPSSTQSQNALIKNLSLYFSEANNLVETSALEKKKTPQKLIYLLDHSYTPKGLSWNHLKNVDSLRGSALKEAARIMDLNIYLALADVHEVWNCEDDYDNYRYNRRRRYYEEDDDNQENDVQVTDLIDDDTTIKYWLDTQNKTVNYKECYVSNSKICWTKATDEFDPFDSHHEGWMGNYGNTVERWYHRAAIILWKKEDHYPVLFEMDPGSVMSELLQLAKKKSHESRVHQIVSTLLPYWSLYTRRTTELSVISTVLKLALYVSDPTLAYDMTKDFDIKAIAPETTLLLLDLEHQYGLQWCLSIFQEWEKPKNHGGSLKFEKISTIVTSLSENKNNNKGLTDWILLYQLNRLKHYNALAKKQDSRLQLIKNADLRISEIIDFIKGCIAVDNTTIHGEIIQHIVNNIELYPALDLVKVLHTLDVGLDNYNAEKWQYMKLFNYIVDTLQGEHDMGLKKEDDWAIKEKPPCTCQDCMILCNFLQAGTEKEKIWPLAEARRSHIHQKIDGLGIPVTHETERKGSPYRLVLTKTDQLHKQASARFFKIQKELFNLTHKILNDA